MLNHWKCLLALEKVTIVFDEGWTYEWKLLPLTIQSMIYIWFLFLNDWVFENR